MLRLAREIRDDLLIPERIAMRTLRERSEQSSPEVLAYMMSGQTRSDPGEATPAG